MSESNNIVPVASDHAGFWMKEFIKQQLMGAGFEIKDLGTYSAESVDYPDFIHPLAKAVNDGVYERGIIACGSGQGAMMTANKYANVRAGLCWDNEQAKLIRLHNNANIISIPGRFVSLSDAWEMVQTFLNTAFEGGRHLARVDKIGKTL
ncbi:MAG: ribose 5-phosphate isomerase B [Bacteroidales bacterium]|nr:ribose 5-phosphate isomerase B [Bacteroidales bacterium]